MQSNGSRVRIVASGASPANASKLNAQGPANLRLAMDVLHEQRALDCDYVRGGDDKLAGDPPRVLPLLGAQLPVPRVPVDGPAAPVQPRERQHARDERPPSSRPPHEMRRRIRKGRGERVWGD